MKQIVSILFLTCICIMMQAQKAQPKVSDNWKKYQKTIAPYQQNVQKLQAEFSNWYREYQQRVKDQEPSASTRADTLKAQEYSKKLEDEGNILKYYAKDYIHKNPNDTLSGTLLQFVYNSYNMPPTLLADAKKVISEAGSALKGTKGFKWLEKYIAGKSRFSVGARYTDFELPDIDGKLHKLSEYVGNGRYVYVEFWASWCAPCRAEIPNVKAAYERLHGKGLQVVSVSLDKNESAWRKAVGDEKMPWGQFSDLKGFSSPVAMEYGITTIPAAFLIGPDGRILALNLRGYDLVEKIAKIMDM